MLSQKKQKRSSRVRFKLKKNNKSRMRLTLYKSSQHLYAQIVDDNKGITVCSASTLKSENNKNSCNVANAKILGRELAKSAAEKGVKDVYLDRGSNLYHGIVKTITDEVRSGGINL